MKIEYVNHGIGNNFGDVIELNTNLKDYPKLHNAVLEHELRHTEKLFSKQDFIVDMGENKISNWELLKFMFRHPKSFSQFLPFYWTKKYGFVYDLNLIIVYSVLGIVITGALYLSSFI